MPTELSERQKTLLDAVVREYVTTAEPVASGEVVRRYQLPYSAATVRGELLALDEAGYLAQPHTSAGRVPTDKGYRFFINHLAAGDGLSTREARVFRELADLTDPLEFIKRSSRILAHLTHNFALAGFPEEELFSHAGIGEVTHAPEFADLRVMQEFSALLEVIEEEISRQFDPEEFDEPQTFIGAENPIRGARGYGMIVSSCGTPFKKESVVALIGPKRMDYEHNLAVLKHLHEVLAG